LATVLVEEPEQQIDPSLTKWASPTTIRLQPQQLIEIDRLPPGFSDGASPALDAPLPARANANNQRRSLPASVPALSRRAAP
jgi:hypothetical protein